MLVSTGILFSVKISISFLNKLLLKLSFISIFFSFLLFFFFINIIATINTKNKQIGPIINGNIGIFDLLFFCLTGLFKFVISSFVIK